VKAKLFYTIALFLVCLYGMAQNRTIDSLNSIIKNAVQNKQYEIAGQCFNAIGNIYANTHDYKNAIDYYLRAMGIAIHTKNAFTIQESSNALCALYEKTGNYAKALAYYETFLATRDSVNSKNTQQEITRQEFKYTYEKKAAADSVKAIHEKKINNTKLQKERFQRYMLYVGIGLAILFGLYIFNRFKAIQKQKNIIDKQKHAVQIQKNVIEDKQKEIMSSIHYARRIQRALLPREKYIERCLGKKS
jgi:tetratricopeptide (TPR) repeat protein